MMFYTQLFTSKRGPLAKIWLAAHWERKLTKAHVFECDLEKTIIDIISPKMKIGLRTSGHLLIGVVRIYSKKANYLLADCSGALVKIKVAFRPDQTDMPVEGLEATIKAITLIEDFTALDAQLPAPSNTDVDHFSLNQSRAEEITIKEDSGGGFPKLVDFVEVSQSHINALLDMSFQSLGQKEDAFGDEDRTFELLDFFASPSVPSEPTDFIPEEPHTENSDVSSLNNQQDDHKTVMETPKLNETTLLCDAEMAFALEPVAITPNSGKERGKRKRKLVVDQTKELTSEFIREQISDYSDLIAPMDVAPPTQQLMEWKESGGVDKLFLQPCCRVATPQIQELFTESVFQRKFPAVHEDAEVMRQGGQEAQRDTSALTTESMSVLDSSLNTEQTLNTDSTDFTHMNDSKGGRRPEHAQDQNQFEFTQPELPSEDSMFVHPSIMEQTASHTQSMLDSQDFEERKISNRAEKLHNTLKSNSDTTFSLEALCEGGDRRKAATTFFCLLVLKKRNVLNLHQSAPYKPIFATPGPKFYS